MSATSWLDGLKETLGEEPRSPREDLRDPISSTVQNMQKPQEEAMELRSAPVVDIRTARTIQRNPDERRLIAAGWTPKDRCGPLKLTIWANPETGFYCSQEVALHRIGEQQGGTA